MSAPNDAGTPAPAQRTAAELVSVPNDVGTPAPAERTAQVQGAAPGPLAARGAVGVTGSGAGAPGKPAGKG